MPVDIPPYVAPVVVEAPRLPPLAGEAAFSVQKAVNAFQVERMRTPTTLDELVPDYLPALPDFGRAFELTWKPPVVGLKRPMPGR